MRAKIPSWRVVWSCGTKTGVSFVEAPTAQDAAEKLKLKFANATPSMQIIIDYAAPDVRDPPLTSPLTFTQL